MGKAEGHGNNWHGHVTALTVSPDYRRLGLAATLMQFLEDVSEKYVITNRRTDVQTETKMSTNSLSNICYFPQKTCLFR